MLKNTKEFQSVYITNYIKHNSVCEIKNLIDDVSSINSNEIKKRLKKIYDSFDNKDSDKLQYYFRKFNIRK